MADKNTMMSFRLSAQNADTLTNLAKELHISKSSIVNDLLDNHLQNTKHQKKLKFLLDDNVHSYKTIKVTLTKNQYDTLKSTARNSITNSVPKLIKLHALNMIYDSKILNSKELEALALTRIELNKIGVNINQIARTLNTQQEAKIDTRLLKILENLQEALTLLRNDIKIICHTSQGLLK